MMRISFALVMVLLAMPMTAYAVSADLTWNAFGAVFRAETNPDECSPTGKTVVSVTWKITNDDDSGVAGNYWAKDAISRLLTIVEVAPGTYCAVVQDFGDFVTVAGLSPNQQPAGAVVAGGIKGIMRGGYRTNQFAGTLKDVPDLSLTGNLGTFDYLCDGFGNCPGKVQWLDAYFATYSGWDYDWWGWITPTRTGRGSTRSPATPAIFSNRAR